MKVDEIILELSDADKKLLHATLTDLSNLGSKDIESLSGKWQSIPVQRRRQIVQRLVELAENNVELNFDGVFKICLKDPDEEVRLHAIEGLWENESIALINPLIRLMERDSSDKVQAAAAAGLGKFTVLTEHGKIRPCCSLRIQEALLAVVRNNERDTEVRRRALEALAPLNLPEVKVAILEAYQSDDPRLIVSALCAMGKNLDPSWLPTLLDELDSPSAEMRYEAATALGELESEDAVTSLIDLAGDPDIDVTTAAINALGKIGGSKSKTFLTNLVDNDNPAIADAATDALDELDGMERLGSVPEVPEDYDSR